MNRTFLPFFFTTVLALVACSDDDSPIDPTGTGGTGQGGTAQGGSGPGGSSQGGSGGQGGGTAGDVYAFDSRFTPGTDSVAYTGQAYRHVLISTLTSYVGGLTARIDADTYNPADADEAFAALNFYYEHDASTSTDIPLGITTDPPAQETYGELGGNADLTGKMAGKDASTDYKNWSTDFVGWSDAAIEAAGGDIDTPEGLALAFMHTLAQQTYDRAADIAIPNEPGTATPIAAVYVTPEGWDLQQLLQKFLLVGVTYSQAADDYLDRDDTQPTKGLLAPNTQDGDKPYSVLEHQWDEGFGYFGAARDYALYTDDELAAAGGRPDWQGYHDTNDDDALDLTSEMNWGISVNMAKRDRGATDPTDFTEDAIRAFLAGRALIASAGDTLTPSELDELDGHATAAVEAWEKTLAATVVHYINAVIADTEAIDGSGYGFLAHAKHFGELKGFALGLQFNPRKLISDGDFIVLHELIGDRPVLATASAGDRSDYIDALLEARDILMTTYGFSQDNVENW